MNKTYLAHQQTYGAIRYTTLQFDSYINQQTMKITGFEHLQLLLLQRFPDIGKIEQSLDSVETAQYKDYN